MKNHIETLHEAINYLSKIEAILGGYDWRSYPSCKLLYDIQRLQASQLMIILISMEARVSGWIPEDCNEKAET